MWQTLHKIINLNTGASAQVASIGRLIGWSTEWSLSHKELDFPMNIEFPILFKPAVNAVPNLRDYSVVQSIRRLTAETLLTCTRSVFHYFVDIKKLTVNGSMMSVHDWFQHSNKLHASIWTFYLYNRAPCPIRHGSDFLQNKESLISHIPAPNAWISH